MSTLSREAKAIIAAGKIELRAGKDDRSRIARLLRHRLGLAALALSSPIKAAPFWGAAKALTIARVAGTIGAVGVLASVTYMNKRDERAPLATAAPLMRQSSLQKPPLQVVRAIASLSSASLSSASGAVGSAKVESTSPSAKASRASLGEEVQILSRAEKDLHNGHPGLALKALDEHQHRFPSGALVQERAAARIQALCALGRIDEATAESLRLKRNSPNSPQAAHTARPCESLH